MKEFGITLIKMSESVHRLGSCQDGFRLCKAVLRSLIFFPQGG